MSAPCATVCLAAVNSPAANSSKIPKVVYSVLESLSIEIYIKPSNGILVFKALLRYMLELIDMHKLACMPLGPDNQDTLLVLLAVLGAI